MALGRASQQLDLLDPVTRFCGETLPSSSIFVFLHEHRETLFPDGMFTDRFTFDARWRYAAGVGGWDGTGRAGFAHTVLVDMRERLRRSDRPDRIFEVALTAARTAGLIGRRRVLDSTPLYDAVATMDTITLIRSAIRGLLTAATARPGLAESLRAVLTGLDRGDDYTSPARPVLDWDDTSAREALIDSRARDGHALLTALERAEDLPEPVTQAMRLLATVLGQDLETGTDGVLRIAHKVAPDRVTSTVDPEARRGHKTSHRGFDGYKGHIAVDPDSGGAVHTLDSFECAIHQLAPVCGNCGCRIVGHGAEVSGRFYYGAHCARAADERAGFQRHARDHLHRGADAAAITAKPAAWAWACRRARSAADPCT
ncbi:hypothetical protein GCM10010399_35350 [Dactylosporangium fulvum]|uniref:Transposase n=1 Tax=Dactylosporangium fulvum TaxID=53359 RepID=A0ABY5WED9_9ACTN|nr:hypothetical protein [Dactylosporangium fulvum]UWP87782.1 hypothetical protein Dfulv_46285 [Dactylosporangium fulvum]